MAEVSKKRKLAFRMSRAKNRTLFNFLVKLNLIIFHWDERKRYLRKNKKATQRYYLIRSRGVSEGLLSTYFYVLSHVKWALENDFIPVVKFDDETCQYFVDREINGTNNAWEYFFAQPTPCSLVDIPNDATVLQSGWTLLKKNSVPDFHLTVETVQREIRELSFKYGSVQPCVWDKTNEIYDRLFESGHTLGVFIRGTDYVALKPRGHYVQPTVEQLKEKIDEFNSKYEIHKIFVVTEDYDIYRRLQEFYGDMVFSSDMDFLKDYNSEDYISKSLKDDPYTRGLNYLIRLLLLTKSDYLVSSITNGSLFVQTVKKDEYLDSYWFDLGLYD